MVMNFYKLSILHGLCILMSRNKEGSRSTFLEAFGLWAFASRSGPISPHPAFEFSIFSHLPFSKGENFSPLFCKERMGEI
jgi:hypothetical protein